MPVTADRIVRLALALTWLALPFTTGSMAADALDDASRPVQLVASAGLWAGWAAVLPALLVPRPVGLTAVRVLAPGAVVVAVAAAVAGHASALGLLVPALAAAIALTPETGAVFVNGAAYPNERRHLLRAPGPLLLGPLPLAWALVLAGLAAGPLLLAARQWVPGVAALAVGVPVALVLLRSLHALTQRWLVFVPTGLVLHDNLSLTDPVLFRRQTIASLGPAPVDTEALDLTQRAPGLALELVLTEPTPVVLTRPGRNRKDEAMSLTRFLCTPSRPGRVLADARERRVRVG